MEYFDLVDSQRNLTGHKKLRAEVHRDGDWHKTVHIWIINSSHSLLLQKRAASKDSYPSMWDISIAGHIEAGSDSPRTVLKEVAEELGIKLTNADAQYLFTVAQQHILKKEIY